MAAVIARHCGARHIVLTDINDYRLNLAKEWGFDHAINIKNDTVENTMKKLNMQEGFTIGFEMSGNPQAFNTMLDCVGNAGKIAMLESGLNLDPIITHTFPVYDFEKAFEIMNTGNSGKVILDWE